MHSFINNSKTCALLLPLACALLLTLNLASILTFTLILAYPHSRLNPQPQRHPQHSTPRTARRHSARLHCLSSMPTPTLYLRPGWLPTYLLTHSRTRTHTAHFWIQVGSKPLDDRQLLSAYNLGERATLHLSYRMCGGGRKAGIQPAKGIPVTGIPVKGIPVSTQSTAPGSASMGGKRFAAFLCHDKTEACPGLHAL